MRNELTPNNAATRGELTASDGDHIVPAHPQQAALQDWPPLQPMHGVFAFRYTSTEIYEDQGLVHVRMKRTRYQDGRLRTEECEGALDRVACERLLIEAQQQLQQQFFSQAFGLARLFLSPFLGLPHRKD